MRILAIASTSFSVSVFCALMIRGAEPAVAVAIAFSLLCAYLFIKRPKHTITVFFVAALFAAAGLLWPRFYASKTVDLAHELDGQTMDVAVELTTWPVSGSNVASADGVLITRGFPTLGVRIYDPTYSLSSAMPGQQVILTARFKSADTRYGEAYEGYLASGIHLIASAKGAVTPGRISSSPRFWPARARQALLKQITTTFPADAVPFMKSLMLGEKVEFYASPSLEVSMSRSGLMHVVAVSGMHLSFLAGAVQLLFGKTRRSCLLCICLIWFFVWMTGSPPSAMRAGVMQSFALCAPVFWRENDSPTSLSFSLALLLALNPYAAKSAALQLSFAAVAGMMLFSWRLNEAFCVLFGSAARFGAVRWVSGIFASSLSVMVLTVPVTAMQFQSVQILSPITNMLVLWAVSLCFCCGYIACLLAVAFPMLTTIAALPAVILMRYITLCATAVSRIPFSSLYTCSDFALYWVFGVYIAAVVFSLLPLPVWQKILLPLTGAVLSLAVLLTVTRLRYNSYAGVFSAVDVGQGQCITVFSGEDTLMIDCGGILSAENAGDAAGRYLLSCGRQDIDLLLLTHLHADHANGIPVLLEYLPIREIALSEYAVDEDGVFESILEAASRHQTHLTFLAPHAEAELGRIRVKMSTPVTEGDENDKCIISLVSIGEYDMLVTGDAPRSTELKYLSETDLKDVDLYVAGHHGSRTSSSPELLKALGADTVAVISSGYNTFGHPSPETLTALSALSALHRTDIEGTVQFILQED